ncbi:hypothetical protein VTO42DRAFT_2347 [Malbranchea cinnamomea]
METVTIACIGVIGRSNELLHISVFPPHESLQFKFSLILNSCLDIIEMKQQHVSVDQDLGLLHVLDEKFAAYGWLTNTGVKFILIVDMLPKSSSHDGNGRELLLQTDLQQADLRPVFQALQSAHIKLSQNPFHSLNDGASSMSTHSQHCQSCTRAYTQAVLSCVSGQRATRRGGGRA